ncbi:MarR family transcriptional regulator [Lysinibacillus sp. HST-98]|uniref:MarR family transcriptional regulator n=1 Tax=Lysinibacillus capsici TaxID=2115968 RepID=A0A2X0Z3R1_9BACI|nr:MULTISPECIES: MarR family transcriptional regulator [Lysinibacillus]EFI70639.1 MarR family transcriptional regulator [Lysinibacillus fusiformis ZC1]EKU40965.1 MarR family transcriptional regulator [Lysinibacillus fusiformis ZB2]AUS88499.1 MarR family transcriptional regulator [Lysinibacillus sp. YS11]KMN37888.1 MarR family transcriptional regulator [Lysinibacillus sp. LK3]MBL3732256.1 MarR family transcriptional regulator [Lysinibacillus sp. HST-98]
MKQNNRNLKAFTVLFRAYQTIQDATRRDLLQFDLNQTEFSVLEFLYHHGEQPVQMIGKKILIASSSITYVIDKLEQKGYVYRKACPRDRRVTYVLLTLEGQVLMEEIFPKHEQKINEIFEVLEAQELDNMILSLKKVGKNATNQ